MTSQNVEEAKNWIIRIRLQLDKKPIDLICTDEGTKRVENLILDIIQG